MGRKNKKDDVERDVRERASEIKDQAREVAGQSGEALKEFATHTGTAAKEFAAKASDAAKELVESIEKAAKGVTEVEEEPRRSRRLLKMTVAIGAGIAIVSNDRIRRAVSKLLGRSGEGSDQPEIWRPESTGSGNAQKAPSAPDSTIRP